MGIYLGANELGGGGGSIGKTVTVGDYNYINAQPLDTWKKLGFGRAATGGGPYIDIHSGDGDTSYTGTVPSSDPTTYVTLANITSATDGGALTLCGLGGGDGVSQWTRPATFKITLDGGTPVEIAQPSFSGNYSNNVFVLGGGWLTRSLHGNAGGFGIYPQWSAHYATPGSQNIDPTSQIPYMTYAIRSGSAITYTGSPYVMYYRADTHLMNGLPFVHFTTSCKVEVKTTAGISANQNAFAEIKTF